MIDPNNKYLFILNNSTEPVNDEWVRENYEMVEGVPVNMGDRGKNTAFVEKETYSHFLELQKYMKKEKGIKISLNSAGRDYEDQKATYDEYVAMGKEKYVAIPGYSEHHLGLALDIRVGPKGTDKLTTLIRNKIIKNKIDEWYKVLCEEVSNFGFILRYPKETKDFRYEKWHYRFIGVEAAKDMKDKGFDILEDYVAYLKEHNVSSEDSAEKSDSNNVNSDDSSVGQGVDK